MNIDELVSPRVKRLVQRAYLGTALGAAVTFLSDWAGFQPGFVVGAAVFLPCFAISWGATLWLFFDASIGDYMRFRRRRNERARRDRLRE